jgi:GWxTD domain-containing protein
VNKSSHSTRQNFLPLDYYGTPLFSYRLEDVGIVSVKCDRCETGALRILYSPEPGPLPPPPFSDAKVEAPDFEELEAIHEELDENNSVRFDLISGFCFVHEPSMQEGLCLAAMPRHYPDIETYDYMSQTLRYITSRAEFENLTIGKNPREKIEDFWLDCAGSKERARELIRIYYNRVKEANYYFSTHREGWQTDRGLIHVVFGNPKRIVRNSAREVWIYGEEDNVNALSFTFEKEYSPYSSNEFILVRDRTYKAQWERAVTSWRNGKIYAE